MTTEIEGGLPVFGVRMTPVENDVRVVRHQGAFGRIEGDELLLRRESRALRGRTQVRRRIAAVVVEGLLLLDRDRGDITERIPGIVGVP